METRKNTTAGVLLWTPAPARTSPTSSVTSEDEEGHPTDKEDDFVSQMNENGIIGLKNVKLREDGTHFTPEDVDPSGCMRDTPPEDLSYSLSDHLSDTEFPGEDEEILSSYDDITSALKALTEDEAVKRNNEQGTEHLAGRGEYLDVTDEVNHGDKEGKCSASKRKENKHTRISGKLCATSGLVESYINKRENKKIRSTQSYGSHTPAGVSSHHCPVFQSATAVTAPCFPHLLHFTAEEIAAAPGIDAETFPDMGFTESLPESHSSEVSLKSGSRCLRNFERDEQKGHRAATISPEQAVTKTFSLKSISSPDRESKTHTVRSRTKAAEVNESKKGLLSYRTPDFSKVEPRVHFPKSGYKPPKSRLFSKKESPGLPIVFKSPADIVKEVLLDDGPPSPSDCNQPPDSAPSATVPQDFRCRQQASMLLEQLQEDYNRLLTKYAEAENTIDRLRLEAKVNLYSDLPKPNQFMQSALSRDASKFMTLDFPQAQSADIKSASRSDGHSSHQGLQVGEQLDKILCNQADKFLKQLQTYQDILQREKLKPFEQVKGLSQLSEGLDSLERAYLLARDEHKRLHQQEGAKSSLFDPERELEGLIYQCGLYMDELKEQVEQMQQEQLTCEAPASPPHHPTLSSVPCEGGETLTHPQTPPVPLLVDHGGAVEVGVSSASEESDEKETGDEESLRSFYLKPVTGKHRYFEQDSATTMDHYQSFRELPKTFDHSLKVGGHHTIALGTSTQPRNKEQETHRQQTPNMEVQKGLPKSKVKSDHQDSLPLHTIKQQTSRFSPSSCRTSTQLTALPVYSPSSCRRLAFRKSHSSSLSSLGDITAPAQRNSKLQTGSRAVLSQDGIISPETDSGFVGSESSHLTPAAAQSPLHQRAPESVAVHQEGRTEKPLTASTTSPASSPSHSHVGMRSREDSHLNPDQPRRSRQRQRRRTFSCSPQHWVSQMEQTRTKSGTSGFVLESDSTHSIPEDGQSDKCFNPVRSSHPFSSPTVQCRHGDSLRALGSSQVAKRNHAIQLLQAEVNTLKERLESCLRNKTPLSTVRAASSVQDEYTPHYTSTPHIRPKDGRQSDDSREKERRTDDDEAEKLKRTKMRSASAQRQKTQPDILTCSELEPSTPQPKPQTSRYTQTSAPETNNCSRTNAVHNSGTHHRQHSAVSETGNEHGRSGKAPLCPRCSSQHRGQSQWSVGGNKEAVHSSHCPVCGHNLYRSSRPECRRDSVSPPHTSCQPAEFPDSAARSRFVAAAAPPALLQCLPVCPPPFVLYSSPVYVSSSNSTGTSSAVRGRVEVRERTRCSLSADTQRSLDSSLDRAIRAARHMKHTSRRMAHSLATGLQYQELLTQSCNY